MSEHLKRTKKWTAITTSCLVSAFLACLAIYSLWCCRNIFGFGQFGFLAIGVGGLAWSFYRDHWGW